MVGFQIKMVTPGRNLNIPIDSIRANPYQPRQNLDGQALAELAASIHQYGLMQPIAVRELSCGQYELIAGERRYRACLHLGMNSIPSVVMDASSTDSAVLALIENIQRENLNYMEEADAFQSLISEHGLTQEELALRLGKSQSAIANKLRLLKLSPTVQGMIREHALTERHARALLKLTGEKERLSALKIIINRGLNVAKTEELIESMLTQDKLVQVRKHGKARVFKDVRIFSNTIKQAIGMMQQAGIPAESRKTEDEDYIEYLIRIPKKGEAQAKAG